MVERQQLQVSEIAKTVSGALTSVLSKLTTGVAAVSDKPSSDELEQPLTPPRPKRRKRDKEKYDKGK